MLGIRETHSCGVAELSYMNTNLQGKQRQEHFRECLRQLAKSRANFYGRDPYMFTGPACLTWIDVKYKDAAKRKRYPNKNGTSGLELAKMILEHGLGRVVSSPWQTNPVHPDRWIKVYTWAIDMPAYKRYLKADPAYGEWFRARRGEGRAW